MSAPEKFRDAIDEIMDTFNFRELAQVFRAMGWKWMSGDNDYIPDETQLRREARRLLTEVTATNKGGSCAISSGRLSAVIFHGRFLVLYGGVQTEASIHDDP